MDAVQDELKLLVSSSLQMRDHRCEVGNGDIGKPTCAVGASAFRAPSRTEQPLFRYAWAGPVIRTVSPSAPSRVSFIGGSTKPSSVQRSTSAIDVERFNGSKNVGPPSSTYEEFPSPMTENCFQSPSVSLCATTDATSMNISHVPSTEAAMQNVSSCDPGVDLDDLLPKVIQDYRHNPSNDEESPSHVTGAEYVDNNVASVLGHDSSFEAAELLPSSSCASARSASTTAAAAASMSVRPALFHAVVRMIALVEGGGMIDRDGPEFDIAVADANYGMLINDSRRLVYTRQYGLQLLEFTD